MSVWKKAVLLLLIGIFSLHSGLAYLLLKHKLWTVKREMKELVMSNLSEESTSQIHLTKAEFESLHWPEPWEFEFNGQMYDISKTEILNENHYVLFAVLDSKENKLKSLVRNLVTNSAESKNATSNFQFVLKTFSQLFFIDLTERTLSVPLDLKLNFSCWNARWFKQCFTEDIEYPPCV